MPHQTALRLVVDNHSPKSGKPRVDAVKLVISNSRMRRRGRRLEKVVSLESSATRVPAPADQIERGGLLSAPDTRDRRLGCADKSAPVGVGDAVLSEIAVKGVHADNLASDAKPRQEETCTSQHGPALGDDYASCMPRRKVPPGALLKRDLRRPFIAEWRKYRGRMSQERLAARVEEFSGRSFSASALSRIENAKSPYQQWQLEAIAEALGCHPADLLIRDPLKPDAIWSIHDSLMRADPATQERIRGFADAVIGENTDRETARPRRKPRAA